MKFDVDAVAARLNAVALPVARARYAELGEDRSGTFTFYRGRMEAGNLFAPYERRLAEAIVNAPGLPSKVHEIGGGWGTLSWLLAAGGHDVLCLDHDELRVAAGEELWAAIVEAWPDLAGKVSYQSDSFPSPGLDSAETLLVATNLVHTVDAERLASLFAAVARYPRAVIDVGHFAILAESAAERKRVIEQFERTGVAPAPFLDCGRPAAFYLMTGTPRAIGRREPSGVVAGYRDVLARRGIDRIAYFHTDHWEPWQAIGDLKGAARREANLERVAEYARRMGALDHGRRLGMFYLPEMNVQRVTKGRPLAVPGDTLGVTARSEEHDDQVRRAFAALDARTDFDWQVHFHHERLTWNRLSHAGNLAAHHRDDLALNGARFDLGLAEMLRRVRNDTGRALSRWFFVHGLWALNGSDPDVCSITDEIARLRSAGCLGDFTMPAGRPQCDPPFDVPSLVRPVDAAKGYATAAADARMAGELTGEQAEAEARFLIWSSRVSHADASLDFESPEVIANFANPVPWGERLLVNSFQRGSTLYVKTHAHSMFPFYFSASSGGANGVFPHEHDAVKRLMDWFGEAAAALGGRLDFLWPSEVYDEVLTPRSAAEQTGYVETGRTFSRAAIEQTEGAAFRVLSERLATMGVEESGLSKHYATLVGRGRIIQPVEIEVLNTIQRLVPAELPVVQGRSAAGLVALALAACGRRVTSIEGSARRMAAQEAILAALAAEMPGLAERFTLRLAKPTAVAPEEVEGGFLLFTDMSTNLDEEAIAAALRLFDRAEMVMLDALRFGERRRLETAASFVERLQRADGSPAQLVLDVGDAGQYYLIDNRGLVRPRRGWLSRLLGRGGETNGKDGSSGCGQI